MKKHIGGIPTRNFYCVRIVKLGENLNSNSHIEQQENRIESISPRFYYYESIDTTFI